MPITPKALRMGAHSCRAFASSFFTFGFAFRVPIPNCFSLFQNLLSRVPGQTIFTVLLKKVGVFPLERSMWREMESIERSWQKYCQIELTISVICHIQLTFSHIFIKCQEHKILLFRINRSHVPVKKLAFPVSGVQKCQERENAETWERKFRNACP